MWKLYYSGRRGQNMPIQEDREGGDPAELAVLPVERGPQLGRDNSAGDPPDHDAPHDMQEGEMRAETVQSVNTAGMHVAQARDAPTFRDGVEQAADAVSPERDDDFYPSARAGDDLAVA